MLQAPYLSTTYGLNVLVTRSFFMNLYNIPQINNDKLDITSCNKVDLLCMDIHAYCSSLAAWAPFFLIIKLKYKVS
jgi:hypothetical protein